MIFLLYLSIWTIAFIPALLCLELGTFFEARRCGQLGFETRSQIFAPWVAAANGVTGVQLCIYRIAGLRKGRPME